MQCEEDPEDPPFGSLAYESLYDEDLVRTSPTTGKWVLQDESNDRTFMINDFDFSDEKISGKTSYGNVYGNLVRGNKVEIFFEYENY
jgi:hypothetical protein